MDGRLIPDAPVCAPSNVPLIGASLEESVTILCRVTADPPNIQFEWTFSSSGERFEVPAGQYTTVQDSNQNTGGGGNNGYGSSANDKSSTYMGQGISSHTEINGKYPSPISSSSSSSSSCNALWRMCLFNWHTHPSCRSESCRGDC